MNKKEKSELIKYFEPPAPKNKEVFLQSLNTHISGNQTTEKTVIQNIAAQNTGPQNTIPATTPTLSYPNFILSQIKYIRKWVWIASAAFFVLALYSARYFDMDMLWMISSFMPVLALTVITESGRSENYGMAEFELAARFSLKNVVLARLLILGAVNMIIIFLMIPFVTKNSDADGFKTVVCIFFPYLLTSFLGLFISRKIRGRGAAYMCAGTAALVSVGNITFYQVFPYIYEIAYFAWWMLAIIFLAAATVNELYKKLLLSEELSWSLY